MNPYIFTVRLMRINRPPEFPRSNKQPDRKTYSPRTSKNKYRRSKKREQVLKYEDKKSKTNKQQANNKNRTSRRSSRPSKRVRSKFEIVHSYTPPIF